MKDLIVKKINASSWWHVAPQDKNSYKKRGKFLASTYKQAEFYGKPSINPEKVEINNPIYGFSELEILAKLFRSNAQKFMDRVLVSEGQQFYEERISLDAKVFEKAKKLGYDAVALMTENGKMSLQKGCKPKSIELNLVR